MKILKRYKSEFSFKNLNINDKIILIQLWYTAGQEEFRSIYTNYYISGACILLVYEITKGLVLIRKVQ